MSGASTKKTAGASPKPVFQKYNASYLKLGMKFTAPVYFEDGENMFLAENCTIKPYHLQAIKQWGFAVILTFGKLTSDSPAVDDNAIPVSDAPPPKPREAPAAITQTAAKPVEQPVPAASPAQASEDLEELEELEDIEELEELEEL
jgi:hypothetical protein